MPYSTDKMGGRVTDRRVHDEYMFAVGVIPDKRKFNRRSGNERRGTQLEYYNRERIIDRDTGSGRWANINRRTGLDRRGATND